MEGPRAKVDIVGMLESGNLIKVCAPMVRFSKLPFRQLVLKYGTDIAVTPMIMSDSFVKSKRARDLAFTTSDLDTPVVAQFAATNAKDFADAAELVFPYVDGVDLNCGCPQSWAMADGYGAKLLTNPELIRDIVHQAKERTNLPISIKIRIDSDIQFVPFSFPFLFFSFSFSDFLTFFRSHPICAGKLLSW
jgi:tRNA-dihydrouridine synthase 4